MSLSVRAHEAKKSGQGLLIWQVLPDLWHPETNSSGIVSLGVAENTLMHESLSKHIHHHLALSNHAFTYGDGPSGSKRLKNAMATFLTRHLRPVRPVEPAHIVVTNGCSAAIEHLSWALANPGEGFLLGQPYYGTFIPDISERPGSKVVPVPFHNVDPLGDQAVTKYEEALQKAEADGTKIAGLILCNPHNPLGRCYPHDIIVSLMQLCHKHQIHFISDEIYALSVWENAIDTSPPPVPFTSCLSIDPTGIIDPARVHALWGMSKDFGANGIRLGAIISQSNPSLHAALVPVNLYSSPSSISEHVTANILEDDAWVESYVTENQRKLAQQYKLAVAWAKENRVAYQPGVNAAFFLWVDLGSIYKVQHPDLAAGELDGAITAALLRNKVFLASGENFGSEKPGWFRIVFSHPEDYLREGLDRILATLRET